MAGTVNLEREKARLLQEKAEIEGELEKLKESLRSEIEIDINGLSPDLYERDKTIALIESLEFRLVSIERALRAIERGTYGICERCGVPIDPARLEARPDATLCLRCQEEVERLLKRRKIERELF
ncbi:MAG: TraR/DksA C4-type zinc finger protein [Anaerolineae bacterium]|nr:TraR/DksA C4-type zinc finger protein [Anaerolineae bacterium]MDW8102788.1 TraR/DksA C4-type zinc finger protein [Anaerolineae bacterium]